MKFLYVFIYLLMPLLAKEKSTFSISKYMLKCDPKQFLLLIQTNAMSCVHVCSCLLSLLSLLSLFSIMSQLKMFSVLAHCSTSVADLDTYNVLVRSAYNKELGKNRWNKYCERSKLLFGVIQSTNEDFETHYESNI